MINRVINFGATVILAAVIAVQGTHESASTTLRNDEAALNDYQPSRGPNSEFGSKSESFGPVSFARLSSPGVDAANQPVLLRPSTRSILVRMRPFDMGLLTATPGGRPISDTYDFASLDPESFAAIKPVKVNRPPVEKSETPKNKFVSPPNEVVGLSAKTLSYMVLTTRMFLENLSRTLYGAP